MGSDPVTLRIPDAPVRSGTAPAQINVRVHAQRLPLTRRRGGITAESSGTSGGFVWAPWQRAPSRGHGFWYFSATIFKASVRFKIGRKDSL